ncbi:alanine acetyltransferase [Pseudoxanthomonas putridarboris]|uniref:Alanine acetyltransferase n=1 Tax=Pseudoxanthomonas putridarboris TaxID=752605 RepID=A0ABU9J5K2_9GAMM
MSLASDRLWSAEQQAWLGALGHALYLPADWPTEAGQPAGAGAESTAVAPARADAGARPSNPAMEPAPSRATVRPPRPSREAIEDAPRARAATPPRGPGSRLPDRLHFALIRASGCNPNAPGAAELFAQWPTSAQLRGNPAAKRALWPALRKLRRTSPP